MSFVFPTECLFATFGEPAVFHSPQGDVAIEVMANFEVDVQSTNDIDFATGYVGVFDVTAEIYEQMQSGSQFSFQGKRFEVLQKKPPDSGVYQVEAMA